MNDNCWWPYLQMSSFYLGQYRVSC